MTMGQDADDVVRWIRLLSAHEHLEPHRPRWRFWLFVLTVGLLLETGWGSAKWLVMRLYLPEWEP